MKTCFARDIVYHVPQFEFIDHRYFYHELNSKELLPRGNYTCGLVRNIVAAELLSSHVDFRNLVYLASPSSIYLRNLSACDFIVEQAILSSIALKGLDIGAGINTPMEVVSFRGPKPKFRTDTLDKPILYRPQKFNSMTMDGIIVFIPKPNGPNLKKGGQKMRLFMFPLKFSLDRRHSDSYEKFLNHYCQWIKDLEDFDVIPEFIWMTRGQCTSITLTIAMGLR